MSIQYLPEPKSSQEVCLHATTAVFILTVQSFRAWPTFQLYLLDCSLNIIPTTQHLIMNENFSQITRIIFRQGHFLS